MADHGVTTPDSAATRAHLAWGTDTSAVEIYGYPQSAIDTQARARRVTGSLRPGKFESMFDPLDEASSTSGAAATLAWARSRTPPALAGWPGW
ncbi:MAG: hypothetical protein QOK02_5655 [Mycobacterium sp.]|nr:hypothetical protein [Mycobacterium sp.]